MEDHVPWAKPGKKAESFWNPDCTRVTEAAKRSRKRYERTRNANDREDLRVAEREKVATLRRERTLHFREAIDRLSANPKGLWAMAKYGKERSTKPKDLPKFPALKIDTNIRAETFEQKVECLRKVHFPLVYP